MTGKPDTAGGGRMGRSAAQQQGSAAMTKVMQAWEALKDEEYLTWRVAGTSRRTKGIDFFKQVSATVPPPET